MPTMLRSLGALACICVLAGSQGVVAWKARPANAGKARRAERRTPSQKALALPAKEHDSAPAFHCRAAAKNESAPSPEEATRIRHLVEATCAQLGVRPCSLFTLIAERESDWRPWMRHVPRQYARTPNWGYLRNAERYGWAVERQSERRRLSLKNLHFHKLPDAQVVNAHFPDYLRWADGGLGLYAFHPAYHLFRWDPAAPPEVLCDPVIATVVAIRLARFAVHKLQARTWLDVHRVFGGRRPLANASTATLEGPDRAFVERAKAYRLNPFAKPRLGKLLSYHPTPDQDEVVHSIRVRLR